MEQEETKALEWWRSVFEPFGLKVAGWTGTRHAAIQDPSGGLTQIPYAFALALKDKPQWSRKRKT